jgi:hypothetical protein
MQRRQQTNPRTNAATTRNSYCVCISTRADDFVLMKTDNTVETGSVGVYKLLN